MESLFDSPRFNESLFFPHRDERPPSMGAEDLFVEVPEGRIRIRLHAPGETKLTLLLFGRNGESAADYDGAGALFAACGARLAVADYRGYGLSEGSPTLRRALADAVTVFETLRNLVPSPIGVMGRSLGSQCAAVLAPRADLACIVWESGFLDLQALVARRGMAVPEAFSEADRAAFDPAPRLFAGQAPLLVLHAEEDEVINPQEGIRAFRGYPQERKSLALIAERGHNDIATSPHYWQALKDFLWVVLAGGRLL